jgi:prevent-host-death family protein
MAAKRVHKPTVGIRELRANLSRFIEAAKEGRETVITEHGRAVARLVPTPGNSTLDRLIAEGIVTPPSRPKTPAGRPRIKLRGKGPSMAEIVAEQRR